LKKIIELQKQNKPGFVLKLDNVNKRFPKPARPLKWIMDKVRGRSSEFNVLNNISLELYPGESLGIIGESGCGKSTLAKAILRLLDNLNSGAIHYCNSDNDIYNLNSSELSDFRQDVQMIFQHPDTAFNPQMRLVDSMNEAFNLGDNRKKKRLNNKGFTGISSQNKHFRLKANLNTKAGSGVIDYPYLDELSLRWQEFIRFPNMLSGGEKKRMSILRALALNPQIIIADEPFAGLDVSLQENIVKLFEKIRSEYRVSFLVISHDIEVVKRFCQRVAVMYLGTIVEIGTIEQVTSASKHHPYTSGLLAASEFLTNPDISSNNDLDCLGWEASEFPSNSNNSKCIYTDRCPLYMNNVVSKEQKAVCESKQPELKSLNGGHQIACHYN